MGTVFQPLKKSEVMLSEGKWVQLEITLLTKGLKVMIPSYFDGQAPVINMHKNVHTAFSKLKLTG